MLKIKIVYWFLSIITLGIYPYISRKRINKGGNRLSEAKNTSINIDKLLENLGTINNIEGIEYTHSKIKIFIIDSSKIKKEEIESEKGVSGIFLSSKDITLVVGNQAKLIANSLMNKKI